MPWYMAVGDTRLGKDAERRVQTQRDCPLCYSKLQRLAWRDLVYPYHWQPFGFICSSCNALYVGAEARLLKTSPSRDGLPEFDVAKKKPVRSKKAPHAA